MSNFFSKLRDFVGFADPVDGLEEFAEAGDQQEEFGDLYEHQPRAATHESALTGVDEAAASSYESRRTRRSAETMDFGHRERRQSRERSTGNTAMGSNVIGLPGVTQVVSEVVVIEPRSFDEMAQVVQHLRDRKSVIMNMMLMEPADAQRSVDFVAGGTFAIDGHQERIGENIFLFTPSCVAVSTPSSEQHQPQVQPSMPRSFQAPTPMWSSGYGYPEPMTGTGR